MLLRLDGPLFPLLVSFLPRAHSQTPHVFVVIVRGVALWGGAAFTALSSSLRLIGVDVPHRGVRPGSASATASRKSELAHICCPIARTVVEMACLSHSPSRPGCAAAPAASGFPYFS